MRDEPNRTVHAQQAFDFVELFGYKFNPLTFGVENPRRLRLREPDGPSTAGGRHARQSLVLSPDDGEGGNLIVGFLDVFQRSAEIRTFQTLADQYEARFSRPIDLDRGEFDAMVRELEGFLKIQKIDVRTLDTAPRAAPMPSVRPAAVAAPEAEAPLDGFSGLALGMLAAGVALGFGLGYLVFGT